MEQEFKNIKPIVNRSFHLPLTVLDDGAWLGPLTRTKLAKIISRGCPQFGWRLIVVDYLGLLAMEEGDRSGYSADCANSSELKRIARAHNIALIAVCALRKSAALRPNKTTGGLKSAAPGLDEILGAARLVYDAVNVFYVSISHVSVRLGDGQPGSQPLYLFPMKTRYSGAGIERNPIRLN